MKKIINKHNLTIVRRSVGKWLAGFAYASMAAMMGAVTLAVLTDNDGLRDHLIEVLTNNLIVFLGVICFFYSAWLIVETIIKPLNKPETTDAKPTMDTV